MFSGHLLFATCKQAGLVRHAEQISVYILTIIKWTEKVKYQHSKKKASWYSLSSKQLVLESILFFLLCIQFLSIMQCDYIPYHYHIYSFNDRVRDAINGGSPFGNPLQQGFSTGLFLEVIFMPFIIISYQEMTPLLLLYFHIILQFLFFLFFHKAVILSSSAHVFFY